MKNPTLKMSRDIDTKKADVKDLVAWYNENSGSKPIKKFESEEKARARCGELYTALRELESGTSKGADKAPKKGAKPTKGAKLAKAAKERTEASGKRGRASAHSGKFIQRNTEKSANPRREGSHGFNSFEIIPVKGRISYEDYMAKGGRTNDLAYDIAHEFVTIHDSAK